MSSSQYWPHSPWTDRLPQAWVVLKGELFWRPAPLVYLPVILLHIANESSRRPLSAPKLLKLAPQISLSLLYK